MSGVRNSAKRNSLKKRGGGCLNRGCVLCFILGEKEVTILDFLSLNIEYNVKRDKQLGSIYKPWHIIRTPAMEEATIMMVMLMKEGGYWVMMVM